MRPMQGDRDQMQVAVADTGLRDHGLGKSEHMVGTSSQDRNFNTVVMVQMSMSCGDRQLVMLVLYVSQSHRQLALVMVVEVTECGNAGAIRAFGLAQDAKVTAKKITERL